MRNQRFTVLSGNLAARLKKMCHSCFWFFRYSEKMSCNVKVKLPDGKSLVIDHLNESDPLRTIHLIVSEKIGLKVFFFRFDY